MKKAFALVIAVVLLIGCCTMAKAVTITATNYPLYSIALQMVGDKAEVILYSGEEPVTEGILLCVADEVTANENVTVIRGTEYAFDPIDGDNDFYTIPVNVILAMLYLSDALSEADYENNDYYQTNFAEIIDVLNSIHADLTEAANKGIIIKCLDGSAAYLAREYGFKVDNDSADAVEVSTMKDLEPSSETNYLMLLQEQVQQLLQTK